MPQKPWPSSATYVAQAERKPATPRAQETGGDTTGATVDTATRRDEPIGERPPEDANELLVRNRSILLKPGDVQSEISCIYGHQKSEAIILLPTGAPAFERLISRRLIVPFGLRYGWSEKAEVFVTMPLGTSFLERDNLFTESRDVSGVLGDVSFGFVRELRRNHKKWPDMTATFSVTAPTTSSPFDISSGTDATLGNGVWQLTGALNLVKSYDPIVLLGGLGYQYPFAGTFKDIDVQFGDSILYYFGLGFGINDESSLGAQITGAMQDKIAINGRRIPNSEREPVTLRLSYLRRFSLDDRLQPYVDIGLTDVAPDFTFGLRIVHDE
jgi:hypothetical protein